LLVEGVTITYVFTMTAVKIDSLQIKIGR